MQRYFIILALILAVCIAAAFGFSGNGEEAIHVSKACIGEKCFNVEIADSYEERQRGLMYRDSLAVNNGMLFMFDDSGRHSFWMKNTRIPLDIIWINADGKIVSIKAGAEPCAEGETCDAFMPNRDSKYVLEVNSGVVNAFGIEEGDEVTFR